MDRFRQILRALLVVERLPPPPAKAPRAPRRRELLRQLVAVEKLPPPPEAPAGKAEPRSGGGIFRALFAIEKLPPYEAPPLRAEPARSPKEKVLFKWIEDLPLDAPAAPRRRLPLLKWLFWPEPLGREAPGNGER